MRSHLAGAVAHDVNNLLHVILGCCERLRSDTHLSAAQSEELQHIIVAVEHAATLTSQVLAQGRRVSSGTATIDVYSALGRLKGLLQRVVGDSVAFEMRLPADHVRVRMDEADIAQVLVNLAVNARDAMPDGGRLVITATVITIDSPADDDVAAGRYLKLDVSDSGAGMTADVRERAFERFFTTKPGEGSGHGLAIVQSNVHRHGGTVEVRSEPGLGTQFTILLPVVDAVEDPTTPTPRARAGEEVLVVDDEPLARDVVASFLRDLGYLTIEAESGRDAIATILRRRRPVGLLIADVTMPDMSGIELAERARELAPFTPTLLISGDTSEPVWDEARTAVAGFLQKPFNSRGLGLKVRSLLDASYRERAAATGTSAPVLVSGNALLDELPVAAFVVQRGRYLYANTALARLLSLDLVDIVGRDCLERIHPDDRELFPDEHSASTQVATTHIRLRGGDGSERYVVLTTVPITHDQQPAVLGVATDVTLQPDASIVAVRMAALGRLAGGVAHDFNNLLLVMGGHIERLQEKLPPDADVRRDVDAIGAAARRAATLTDKLLSFGRRQLLSPEIHDLGAIVESATNELHAMLDPSIDLRVECAAGVPPIKADISRLREVLWHLVENAREAMSSGGTLTIAIDSIEVDRAMELQWAFLKRGTRFTRLRVMDTGRGMDPSVAAHAFEPFFTTKAKGRGAGMGLASVYGIVKQSGGYVFAERTGEHGTCMTVLLPPAAVRLDVVGITPQPDRFRLAAGGGRPRILLVEDDAGVRELLVDLLDNHGYDVESATTAEDAQDLARTRSFDLLLSDVDLPAMNGARLARILAERQPALRVILMSGYPDDGTIDGELATRPMFLRKPFSSAFLIEQVGRALASRAS